MKKHYPLQSIVKSFILLSILLGSTHFSLAESDSCQLLVKQKEIKGDSTFFNTSDPIEVYYAKQLEDYLSMIYFPENKVIQTGIKKQVSPNSEIITLFNEIHIKEKYPLAYFWQYTYKGEMYNLCFVQQSNQICLMGDILQYLPDREPFKDGRQRIVSLQLNNAKHYTFIGKPIYKKIDDFVEKVYKQKIKRGY